MTLVESIISGLTLAFLSGITWLAYKYPHAYNKIINKLLIVTLFVPVCIMAYDMGVIKAFGPAISIPIIAFSSLGVFLYFMFLHHLPNLLKKDDDKKPQ